MCLEIASLFEVNDFQLLCHFKLLSIWNDSLGIKYFPKLSKVVHVYTMQLSTYEWRYKWKAMQIFLLLLEALVFTVVVETYIF